MKTATAWRESENCGVWECECHAYNAVDEAFAHETEWEVDTTKRTDWEPSTYWTSGMVIEEHGAKCENCETWHLIAESLNEKQYPEYED